jgi:hypothetical protein
MPTLATYLAACNCHLAALVDGLLDRRSEVRENLCLASHHLLFYCWCSLHQLQAEVVQKLVNDAAKSVEANSLTTSLQSSRMNR